MLRQCPIGRKPVASAIFKKSSFTTFLLKRKASFTTFSFCKYFTYYSTSCYSLKESKNKVHLKIYPVYMIKTLVSK